MDGSAWFDQYAKHLGHDREASMAAVLHAVSEGWDVRWPMLPVYTVPGTCIKVASRYFAIGTPDDYIYVPLDAPTAVLVCAARGCLLPTRKIVKAIWDAADVRVDASSLPMTPEQGFPRDEDMFDVRRWPIYSQRVRDAADCNVHRPDADGTLLMAGSHKDVVLSNKLVAKPASVAIYGWQRADGSPIQGPSVSTAHIATYYDYSHGIRLCSETYQVGGDYLDLEDGLTGDRAAALSDEGPLEPPAFYPDPSVPHTDPSPSHDTIPPDTTPPTTRRGDTGEWVVVIQKEVHVTADGIFGPNTEQKVKVYQAANDLTSDGIVGPNTWAVILADEPEPEPLPEDLPDVAYPETIPFVQAKNYTRANRTEVRWVVIHSMEAGEHPGTAENVAAWFAGSNAPQASAHYNVDSDSIVQSVEEKDIAWHAKSGNRYGVGLEHAGYHNQGTVGWWDDYSQQMLALSAKLCARICKRWDIEAEFLDADALQDPTRTGLTYHATVTKAFRVSGGHIDPGPDFPIDAYLRAVRRELDVLKG